MIPQLLPDDSLAIFRLFPGYSLVQFSLGLSRVFIDEAIRDYL
jgi:hypothetical protein